MRSLTQPPLLIALELPFSISSGKKIPEKALTVVLEDYDLKVPLPHPPLPSFPPHSTQSYHGHPTLG